MVLGMLKYELIEGTDDLIRYKYYPEGMNEYGVVYIDKRTGNCGIETMAPEDCSGSSYILHMFSRMQSFLSANSFRQSGKIAWM